VPERSFSEDISKGVKDIGSPVELPFWVVGMQVKNGLAFTVELIVAGRSRMPGI